VSLMPPPYAVCQHKQRIVFGVTDDSSDMKLTFCNRPQALASLDDSHHHLSHMLHHAYTASGNNDNFGCHHELVAFEAANFQRGTGDHGDEHGADSGDQGSVASANNHRRMSSGGSQAPWVCDNITLRSAQEVNCGAFEEAVDCTIAECDKEISHLCGIEPNFFTLIGHTGVSMMIFESGMHFDFKKAGAVGPWATVIAVLGTFLPLVVGLGLVVGMNA